MRQGQQNRRNRGRNNNNNSNNNPQHRRGQNPLTRNFESTGPDVKIRGTPAHIAEKYMALARDAHSSGDPVLAESYLQHAEHYNRIIMAYREQQIAQGVDPMSGQMTPRPRPLGDPSGMGDDGDEHEGGDDLSAAGMGQPAIRGSEPQPRFDDRPQRGHGEAGHGRQHQHGNGQGRDRQGESRYSGQERGDRGEFRGEGRGDRQGYDRGERRPQRFDRQDRGPDRGPDRAPVERGPEVEAAPSESEAPRRRERPEREDRGVPHHEQPDFLRRPVRRPRREGDEEAAPATTASDDPIRRE